MMPVSIPIMIAVGFAAAVTIPGSPFSVQFPVPATCEFTLVKGQGKPVRMRSCRGIDEKTQNGYSAEYVQVKSGSATPQEVLLGAATSAASAMQSKVSAQNFHAVNGHPALDATLQPKGRGWITFVRYVLVDKSLVTLTADGYRAAERPQEVTNFFETLSVPAMPAAEPQ